MKQADGSIWVDSLGATSLGWDLALPIFGGVVGGHLLDRRLNTGYAFTLGLLVLGTVTGFYNVLRFIKRLDSRDQRAARASEDNGTAR